MLAIVKSPLPSPATACLWGLAIVVLVGCDKHALRYDDDVDVPGIQKTFDCDQKPAGDKGEACRILGDFTTASAFTEWPKKGVDTWYGRKVCIGSIDSTDHIEFGHILLKPGLGKASFPDNVKTDSARDLTTGAAFLSTSAGNMTAPMMAGYKATIEAAEKGVEPVFSSGLSELDHGAMVSFWERAKKPPGVSDFERLVQSTGPSALGNPFTKDAPGKTPSARYFIRAVGLRMIVLYPSWATPPVPCVAELWKIRSQD